MKEYKLEGDLKSSRLENSELSNQIKKLYNSQFYNSSSNRINIKDNSSCRITVDPEEYKSPMDSFATLFNNKSIFNKILTNNMSREVNKFNSIFVDIEKKNPINLKKIKISNMMPKNNDLLSNVQSNKNDRKSLLNLIVQQLAISGPSGTAELYAFYLYSKKVFPEGREQFSLSYDTINMIIFGGISTKSFNDLWFLDAKGVEWKKINYEVSSPNPRFGHTATLFQKRLYLFGGRTKQTTYSFNSDVEIFNLGY